MRKGWWMVPALLITAQVYAAGDDITARVQRLEQTVNSGALMNMLNRLDEQQRQMEQMQGTIEELRHQLENLQQRQRDLYMDTDRRISRLEREGVPQSAGAPVTGSSAPEVAATAELSGDANPPGLPGSSAPAVSPAELNAERAAYQKAFDVLRELRYDEAISAFQDFLTKYPNGRYAYIAQYWLGEANYARHNFDAAIKAYQTLAERFPTSAKTAEALLKIGYSYNELGKPDLAKSVLQQLMPKYPGTTEAGQAQNLLKQLRKPAAR